MSPFYPFSPQSTLKLQDDIYVAGLQEGFRPAFSYTQDSLLRGRYIQVQLVSTVRTHILSPLHSENTASTRSASLLYNTSQMFDFVGHSSTNTLFLFLLMSHSKLSFVSLQRFDTIHGQLPLRLILQYPLLSYTKVVTQSKRYPWQGNP